MPICPQCKKENPELGAKCPRCADSYYVYDDAIDEADRDLYIGKKAADKYVIVSRISEGGMGTVYRALQLPVEREVAFKVLRAELEDNDEVRDRFTREARAVSKINHPNIITLHDFGFDESDYPYMVMEYAPGKSLDEWIYDSGVTLERIIHVFRQMLSALADAHEQGIVHRDLKPENIMVTGTGTDADFIKLLDFGIARLVNEQATEGLTREGEVFGTPHYMSPEQAEGKMNIGPPADVYASGIMLYEMLCRDCPFDAPKPLSILFKQINEELPELRPRPGVVVPQALENLMRRATAKEPDRRFATAGDMLQELERLDDPDRSGLIEAAGSGPSGTMLGVGDGEATEPLEREKVETANTLGYDSEQDRGSNLDSLDGGAGSNDVSVDTPTDDLYEFETETSSPRGTYVMVAALAVLFIGGFLALFLFGGDTEPGDEPEGEGQSGIAMTDDAGSATEESTPTVAAMPDAGSDAAGSAVAQRGDAERGDTSKGTRRAEKSGADQEGTLTATEGTQGGGRETSSDEESTGSAPGRDWNESGGSRDDEPETSPTHDRSEGGSGAETASSSTGAASSNSGTSSDDSDDDSSDDGTELEKFGSPDEIPTKFEDPSKFGPPE